MTTRCVSEHCEGVAAPGLRVCLPDRGSVAVGLADMPGLYEDLADAASVSNGQRVDTSPSPPMPLGDRARWAREAIRLCLVTWVKILNEDFGVMLPEDTVPAMAGVVSRWADRLLNTEHADQLVHDVEVVMRDRWIAYPVKSRGIRVPCPGCGQRVRLDPDAAVIECPGCDEWGTLDWWWATLAPESREPMTAAEVVGWLQRSHGVDLPEPTLRFWVQRGLVDIVGLRPTGAAPANLYVPAQVAWQALRASQRLGLTG